MYFPDAIASCGVKEDYVFSFGEIVGKDSSNVQSFGFPARILDMKCIDADLQEIDMHPAMRNKTMDALVGLAVFDDTDRHFSAPLLVPVELDKYPLQMEKRVRFLQDEGLEVPES